MNAITQETLTLPQALVQAKQWFDSGQLAEAEMRYWQILNAVPQHPEALHGLGLIALRRGQAEAALPLLEQAVAGLGQAPNQAGLAAAQGVFLANWGLALHQVGQTQEAMHHWRQSLVLNPLLVEVERWVREGGPPAPAADGRQKPGPAPVMERAPDCLAPTRPAVAVAPAPRPVARNEPMLQVGGQLLTITQALQVGLQWHQAGQFDAVENLYRMALTLVPGHAEVWHRLGAVYYQRGQYAEAEPYLRRAAELDDGQALYHANLGAVRKALGMLDEAAASCRRALELKPDYSEALNNLGTVLDKQKQSGEAMECYRRALALNPNYADPHYNLGNMLLAQDEFAEAEASYRRGLVLNPNYAEAHNNLGVALFRQKQFADAEAGYRRALELNPRYAEAYTNLGALMMDRRRFEEAGEFFRQALALNPNQADGYHNLGGLLMQLDRKKEALPYFQQALALAPDHVETHYKLGLLFAGEGRFEQARSSFQQTLTLNPEHFGAYCGIADILQRSGRYREALEQFRQACALAPDSPIPAEGLLFLFNYLPDGTAEEYYTEHVRFAERFEMPLKVLWRPHGNPPDPQRKLRIGYVSGDFRNHSVAYFFEPVLTRHDRRQVEVVCYSSGPRPDQVTARLQALADRWRDLAGLDDAEAAEQVRQDEIDILIDLAGHTGHNRLPLFARKPAPVQVTWLGYPGTTGLSALDYRLVDQYIDPVETSAVVNSETLFYLPDAFAAYQAPVYAPDEVGALPALGNGYVTFGSFNNITKMTDEVVAVWARVLDAVPGSRLLLKNIGLDDPLLQARVRERFAAQGMDPERLWLLGRDLDDQGHWQRYRLVDIGLDPFPYNGATTTCEALWMGVPVVVLAGNRSVARMGVSLVNNAGLPELAAHSPDEYVATAARLAGDLERLATLRQGLRGQLVESPLFDVPRFTAHLEDAYRQMWQAWCANPTVGFARAR